MAAPSILLRGGTILVHDENDGVTPLENTDILIEGDKIQRIGKDLISQHGKDANVIDCTGKIISPGFIDTHHHLWQTQLKGRHADHTLMDYLPSGYMQSYCYTPQDIFWGQLGGCLEAIDAGTTFVLDHMHAVCSKEHALEALRATETSGLRSVYAYTVPHRISKWDTESIIPEQELMPEWAFQHIEELAAKQPLGDGLINIGLGFDLFFLPKEVVVGVYERFRKAGVKIITSHAGKGAIIGNTSVANLLKDYGLLGPDIVLSHANQFDPEEYAILSSAGVHISSTPETECQMAMGWPVALEPGVKGSLGIDCHTNNTSSIITQARMLLQMARQQSNLELLKAGKYPQNLRGSTERAFNLATIEGARAVGMADRIGSIAEGKLADLVIFDATSPGMICAKDPLVALLRHSDVRDIECVIVNGKIRKLGGQLLPVSIDGKETPWAEVAKELLASKQEVMKRSEGVSEQKARELITKMWYINTEIFEKVD